MAEVQVLPVERDERVESGAVKFQYKSGESDWTGLFLRGDDSFGHALAIGTVCQFIKEQCEKENMKMKTELFFALKQLAGVADDIHANVVMGERIVKEDLAPQIDAVFFKKPSQPTQT